MKKTLTLNMYDCLRCPERKLEYNRQMFGVISGSYDFITRALSFRRDAIWKDRLVSALPEMSSPACLDLACGTGDITFRLAERYADGRIVALDVTESMLALAKSRCRYPNVEFVLGNMCDVHLPDASFDIVTGGYALRNAPDIDRALDEIRRVLKPGSTAAFLDFSKPANRPAQKIEYLLLKTWGGFWGLALHRNPRLYTYIAESLKLFPDREQFKQRLRLHGFQNVRSTRHFCGFAETFIFEKPGLEASRPHGDSVGANVRVHRGEIWSAPNTISIGGHHSRETGNYGQEIQI
jgi:demethylmenaquinone methyltransferase/2-methoxy-6-polyprenyl-1,4-benzoquinol methylase